MNRAISNLMKFSLPILWTPTLSSRLPICIVSHNEYAPSFLLPYTSSYSSTVALQLPTVILYFYEFESILQRRFTPVCFKKFSIDPQALNSCFLSDKNRQFCLHNLRSDVRSQKGKVRHDHDRSQFDSLRFAFLSRSSPPRLKTTKNFKAQYPAHST